jgi:hypothetical protein
MTATFAVFFAPAIPAAVRNRVPLACRFVEALIAPDASGLVFPLAPVNPR